MKKVLPLLTMLCFTAPAVAQEWKYLSTAEQAARIMGFVELCKRHSLMYLDDPRVEKIKAAYKTNKVFQREFAKYMRLSSGFDGLNHRGRRLCHDVDEELDILERGLWWAK